MPAAWPSSLPRYFEARSLNIVPYPRSIQTPPELGPVRTRRRTSMEIYRVTGILILTEAQRDELYRFYRVTLRSGVSRFTWHHPWNAQTPVSMKFIGRAEPPITAVGSLIFHASCTLEMII